MIGADTRPRWRAALDYWLYGAPVPPAAELPAEPVEFAEPPEAAGTLFSPTDDPLDWNANTTDDEIADAERLAYRVYEAAARLGVSTSALYYHIRAGTIPHTRIGRSIMIPAAALRRLVEGRGE